MRTTSVAAAVAGALALSLTLAPPASADTGPDPALLAALQQTLQADSAEWSAHGGTAATKCEITIADFGGISLRSGVQYAGRGGAAHLTTGVPTATVTVLESAGAALRNALPATPLAAQQLAGAAAGDRAGLYLTPRAAVLPLPARAARALARHGLRTSASWFRLTAKQEPLVASLYEGVTSLPEVGGYSPLLDDGAVLELTATSTDAVTRYEGKVALDDSRGAPPADFVAVVTAGHLSRFVLSLGDELGGTTCVLRLALDRPAVTVPRTPARHNAVVAEEVAMLSMVRGLQLQTYAGGHRARVHLLQAYAYIEAAETRRAGHPVVVSELRDGVVLTRTLKGWNHPLRWQLKLDDLRLVSYSVRTAPRRR